MITIIIIIIIMIIIIIINDEIQYTPNLPRPSAPGGKTGAAEVARAKI